MRVFAGFVVGVVLAVAPAVSAQQAPLRDGQHKKTQADSDRYWIERAKVTKRVWEGEDYPSVPVEYETKHFHCVVYQDGGPNSARLVCAAKDGRPITADDGQGTES